MATGTLLPKIKATLIVVCMFLFSVKGFSQDPGDNPDGPPPAVPFNDYAYWILIAAGAILVFYTINRMKKKVLISE